jgi:hypothetical protein
MFFLKIVAPKGKVGLNALTWLSCQTGVEDHADALPTCSMTDYQTMPTKRKRVK